jgi:hypothetical protein
MDETAVYAGALQVAMARTGEGMNNLVDQVYPYLPPRKARDRFEIDIRRLMVVYQRAFDESGMALQKYWWLLKKAYLAVGYDRFWQEITTQFHYSWAMARIAPLKRSEAFRPGALFAFESTLWMIDALHDQGLVVEEKDECPIVFGDVTGTVPPMPEMSWYSVESVANWFIERPDEEHEYWVYACEFLLRLEHAAAALETLIDTMDELIASAWSPDRPYRSRPTPEQMADIALERKLEAAMRAISSSPYFSSGWRGFT